MDTRYLLAGIGLVLGMAIALVWELKSTGIGPPRSADAVEPERSPAPPKAAEKRVLSPKPSSRPAARHEASRSDHGDRRPIISPSPVRVSEPSAKRPPIPASAPARIDPARIRIERVLVGGELMAARLVPESVFKEHEDHSKYLVYFELSTTSADPSAAPLLHGEDFRLEDNDGAICSPLTDVQDRLSSSAAIGHARIVFAVYNDSSPARLLYRTTAGEFVPLAGPARR